MYVTFTVSFYHGFKKSSFVLDSLDQQSSTLDVLFDVLQENRFSFTTVYF